MTEDAPVRRALVVGDPSGVREQLVDAARNGDFEVDVDEPVRMVAEEESEPRPCPDLLLVSSALGLQRLATVSLLFAEDGRAPTTVVYQDDSEVAELDEIVEAGFDCIVPPFVPNLLRNRLVSCWERAQLAGAVEEQAGVASLREYERELGIAHDIQAGFLPQELPQPTGWELASSFAPAKQVAGDFYDAFELENAKQVAFLVADVCDKGVGSALFMALIRTLLRHTAEHTDLRSLDVEDDLQDGFEEEADPQTASAPLVQAVVATNRYMTRHHHDQAYFATLFFGVFDPVTGWLSYINGGHNPAVLNRAHGNVELLAPSGPAVGMQPDGVFTLKQLQMFPEDTLLVYSDGVTEAKNEAGDLFTTGRLLGLLAEPDHRTGASTLLGVINDDLARHVGQADPHDDVTMLALRRDAG